MAYPLRPGISLSRPATMSQRRIEVAPVCFGGAGYLRIAAAPYNTGNDYDRLASSVRELLDRQ
jgi:selenocysteine lyase/cysteine desulfurase